MAKTKSKNKSKPKEDKPLKKKADSKKKENIGNKKTKSATSEKSVKKKIASPKKEVAKKPAAKKPSKAKVAKEPKKKAVKVKVEPTVTTENPNENKVVTQPENTATTTTNTTSVENPVEKNIPQGEVVFRVNVPEIGFLKSAEGSFGVKLIAGVTIKRRDALNFEFRGVNADNTPFGTIFDCIDKTEADTFMREVLEAVKTGQIVVESGQVSSTEQQKTEQPVTEQKVADPLQSDTQPKDYKGVPLKTEDMDELVNKMKQNEQGGQNNANVGVTNNPVTNVNNPVVNPNPNPTINVQPPISNTHTPDPNFNPTIPSQNPMLTPNPNPVVNVNSMSDEQLLANMRAYANSIEDTVNNTFQVRIQGGLAMADFNTILKQMSGEYTYDLKNDGKGHFLNVNKGGYQLRVPENPDSYLKIY